MKQSLVALVLPLCLAVPACRAATPVPSSQARSIDYAVAAIVDGARRSFGKAVAFCSSAEGGKQQGIDAVFAKYIADLAAGTRSGLEALARTEDVGFLVDRGGAKMQAMQTQRGDALAETIQASPDAGCRKLAEVLGVSSVEIFEKAVGLNYEEYRKKRQAYCAAVPKPKNCE